MAARIPFLGAGGPYLYPGKSARHLVPSSNFLGNYIGPTINRTARLRDLAHGGQTVISGAAEPLVVDQLPSGIWLADLGTTPLRDLPGLGLGGGAVRR